MVSLNFSLTADPRELRQPGEGSEVTAIVLTPMCEVPDVTGTNGLTTRQCGPSTPVQFINVAEGKQSRDREMF